MKISTLRINAWNSNKAPTSTFPLQRRFANRTVFSYPCRSAVDINCQVCGGGRKIKRAQLSPQHPIAAMSLKRMLCSAVLLHYQQTDNLFDSASRESAAMCCACYALLPISINGFLLVIAACASAFLSSCSKIKDGWSERVGRRLRLILRRRATTKKKNVVSIIKSLIIYIVYSCRREKQTNKRRSTWRECCIQTVASVYKRTGERAGSMCLSRVARTRQA